MREGDRSLKVSLRSLTIHDCDERYFRWLHDEKVTRYLEVRFNPPSTIVELQKSVQASLDDPSIEILAIEVDLNFIGTIRISDIDRENHTCNVGYMIGDRSYWGKGVGKTAVSIAVFNIFYRYGLNSVLAGALEQNQASKRLLESVGFSDRKSVV